MSASPVENRFSTGLPRRRLLAGGAAALLAACGGGGGDGGSGPGGAGTGRFTAVASMRTGRDRPSAVRLPSGRVLVAGGQSGASTLTSAELYDPASGQWTPAAPMSRARFAGSNNGEGFLVSLPNGRVLALGGTAEWYDPAADAWTPLANTPAGLGGGGTKTLLKDGRLLLIPGISNNAYLFDPANGNWATLTGFDGRRDHAATLLADGRVLVSGGNGSGSTYLSTTLLFDPANGSWRAGSTLRVGRYMHYSFALADGRVVVSHGIVSAPTLADSTEIYDPGSGSWRSAGNIHKFSPSTSGATGTRLKDGRFLVAGGRTPNALSPILDQAPQGQLDETNAEWFDAEAGLWRRATAAPGGLVVPRYGHAAVALDDGSVLLVGGAGGLTAAEVFRG